MYRFYSSSIFLFNNIWSLWSRLLPGCIFNHESGAVNCVVLEHDVGSIDWQCELNQYLSLALFYLLGLDLLPMSHIVLHVRQVNTLLIVHIHNNLLDDFVSPKVVLSYLDMLYLVRRIEAEYHLRVSEFGFGLEVIQAMVCVG